MALRFARRTASHRVDSAQVYGLCIHKTPMVLTVDTNDRRPIYQHVADGVKALIARGDLAPRTALPPVRQLAAHPGVNLNTIAAAYRELQTEGLLTVRHGSGAVVAPRRAREYSDDELRRPLRSAL